MTDHDVSTRTAVLLLAPALIIYALLAYHFNFVQDDAYISYRYVANFLDGHGLVYNVGERVEGYTNFGWVILLSLFGALGADYIALSQLVGLLCGAGLVGVTYLISRHLLESAPPIISVIPAYVVAALPSLAYWAPAGLETAAFALAATASVYWYLTRSRLLVFGLLVAVWLRPEGAFVAALLLLAEAVTERRVPYFSLGCGVMAFVLSLPYVVFKIAYYGSLLPNPFYAKTGFGAGQFLSGAEYAGRFFSHYPLLAVALAGTLLLYRRLSAGSRVLVVVAVIYTLYIAAVGGDVLKVHRFFLPVAGTMAVLLAVSVYHLVRRAAVRTRLMAGVLVGLTALMVTTYLPWDYVSNYNYREKKFTRGMELMADALLSSDDTKFSVAISTIGMFGYKLLGHDVIDMLGLTDSTIARHPEPEIPGMETTWKERSHNSAYLLERGPDYILFSTGYKPSAPAEKTLMLYRQFLDSYRALAWYIQIDPAEQGTLHPAFKKVHPISGPLEPTVALEFVDNYKLGVEAVVGGRFAEARRYLDQSLRAAEPPYYPYAVYFKAFCHMMQNEPEIATRLYDRVVAADSVIFEAHQYLWVYALAENNRAKAAIHERWIKETVPWYYERAREITMRLIQNARQAGPGR